MRAGCPAPTNGISGLVTTKNTKYTKDRSIESTKRTKEGQFLLSDFVNFVSFM